MDPYNELMSSKTCTLVFTRDLRLHDNKAVQVALDNFEFVVPVFTFDNELLASMKTSGNRISYLCECLIDLKENLNNIGSELYIRQGNWQDEVLEIARQTDSTGIIWSRDLSSYAQNRDKKMKKYCEQNNLDHSCVDNHTVIAPESIWPKASPIPREFKVFTPYYNRWHQCDFGHVLPKPKKLSLPNDFPKSLKVGQILKPEKVSKSGFSPNREMGGEERARKSLNKWVKKDLSSYEINHNDLAADKTSHISSALHFGTLSAREVAIKLQGKPGGTPFIRQLCWRDFYHQILFYNPQANSKDYVNRNDTWNVDNIGFEKWCEGKTGYPIVDAAMRQLQQEGFMHNRARMVVASFLTKDLYIDWKLGANWFMRWLTDGDIANNYLNWQWVAGTGTDTNPNRIFNPIRQSERFDPEGTYIKRYVPELKHLDTKDIHFPHHLRERLDGAKLLGDYPEPIVDHSDAIARYKAAKQSNKLDS